MIKNKPKIKKHIGKSYKSSANGNFNKNQKRFLGKYPKVRKTFFKFEEVIRFSKWICTIYGLPHQNIKLLYPFIRTLCHYEKNKGSMFLILVMKEVRVHLENYFLGSLKKDHTLVKLRYCGIPTILGKAIHMLKEGEQAFKVLVLSILTMGRSAKFKKSPNFSTISDEKTCDVSIPISTYINFNLFLKSKMSVSKFRIPLFKHFHFSVKASPMGDNSLESLILELVSLPKDLKEHIFQVGGRDLKFRIEFLISNFKFIAKASPNFSCVVDKLIKRYKSRPDFIHPIDIYDPDDKFYTFLSSYVRKMVSFAEYEGKTRIIGLVEYWSQAALEPLATLMFDLLNTIPQDQTFDQAEGCKELSFSPHKTYFSLDLTAFTDRFPMEIISKMLTIMFNSQYSESITYILCGLPFWSPDLDGFISYKVGNPMGTKASWALTTLCHHMLIFQCCQKLNIDFNTAEYKILGDDIVIWNEQLATEYQLIIESIGVNISYYKSITSKDGFTFAKRLFTSTGEISPVSYRLWAHSMTNYSAMIELISMCRDRFTNFLTSEADTLRAAFTLMTKNNRFISKSIRNFIKYNRKMLLDISIKKETLVDNVSYIIKTYSRHFPKVFLPWSSIIYFKNLLESIMLEMIKQGIQKFDGFIRMCPDNITDTSEQAENHRMMLLAFDLSNADEITDLLSFCLPHEEINQRLILDPLKRLIVSRSNGTISSQDILKHLGGLRILNYDRIEQLKINSLDLSNRGTVSMEISKLVISIIKTFIKSVDSSLEDVINLTPLMVIPDKSLLIPDSLLSIK